MASDQKLIAYFQRFRLHSTAQNNDLETARQCIKAKYPLNRFDDLDRTPLHYAVEKNHFEIAKLRLEAGADINAHSEARAGNTPLRQVAKECSLIMAKFLLDAGADPRIPGWMQLTALHVAENRIDPQGHAIYKLMKKAAEKLNSH